MTYVFNLYIIYFVSHHDGFQEWSFAVWRNGDIIAQDRTDVAGLLRRRPIKPADTQKPGSQWGVASLGHPDGLGNSPRRGEYLSDGTSPTDGPRTNTVGNGQSKWVSKKDFIPWNPNTMKVKSQSTTTSIISNHDTSKDQNSSNR